MGFGENPDRPAFAVGFDDRQRFRFGGVKDGDGFLNVHGRIQHDVPMMQNADKAGLDIDIRRMRLG